MAEALCRILKAGLLNTEASNRPSSGNTFSGGLLGPTNCAPNQLAIVLHTTEELVAPTRLHSLKRAYDLAPLKIISSRPIQSFKPRKIVVVAEICEHMDRDRSHIRRLRDIECCMPSEGQKALGWCNRRPTDPLHDLVRLVGKDAFA